MSIFKNFHKFMKRGRIHKVVKMIETEENKHVRKTKRDRRRPAKGNA